MKTISIITYLSLIVFALLSSSLFAQNDFVVKEMASFEINSAITPATFRYLERVKKLDKKTAVLIKLNTPGGLVSTTKDILTLLGSQSRPVIIWVTPEGASSTSAGAILSSAAHFLYMHEGTNIGAATPIGLGSDIKENDQRSKAINDLVALVKALCESRGRPVTPFVEMIETAKSFTANEALKLKFIDGVVNNRSDILTALDQKNFNLNGEKFKIVIDKNLEWKEMEQDLGDNLLNIVAHPSTAYILFILGIALLYFEMQAPGGYVAGSAGVIALILAAIAFQVLPLNWGGMGLMLAGIIFIVLEVYVTSYGLLGVAGVGAFAAGSLFLFDTKEAWLMVNYQIIFSILAAVVVSVGFLSWYLFKDSKKVKNSHFFVPINEEGTVLTHLGGENYQIKVRGEIWKAHSKELLALGERVKVTEQSPADHLVLYIKKHN